MQIEAFGSFSVHVWWTLSWCHDNFFVRGDQGSVSDRDFVNEMQIQALMAAVYVMGGKSLLFWNFDEILF